MDQKAIDREIQEREGFIEKLSRGSEFGNKADQEAIAHHSQAVKFLKTQKSERRR